MTSPKDRRLSLSDHKNVAKLLIFIESPILRSRFCRQKEARR